MTTRILTWAGIALLLAGSTPAQESASAGWGKSAAEKLSSFLPKPAAGLVPRTPWGRDTDNKVDVWSGVSGGEGEPEFLPLGTEQLWAFDDPKLFEEVAAAHKEHEGVSGEIEENVKAHRQEIEAMQKQIANLYQQGKTSEAQALTEKMQSLMGINQPKTEQAEERLTGLKRCARQLHFSLVANTTPYFWSDSLAQRIGSLAGHPLYTCKPGPTGIPAKEVVNLEVYLGPPGLPSVRTRAGKPEEKIKFILVWVEVKSDAPHPDTIKGDEAVARQMLEKVDYAGLAKLLQN